ncbi:MAG: extracellular solute-binding protein [Clostridiaceae bacterium]|nr:extracellular solute-binding protein [Clostridiaceae bacterium]
MKTKKLLSIITCGLVITSMLVGCGSSTSSSSSSSSTTKGAAKEVHLKMFLAQSGPRLKTQFTEFTAKWAAKYLAEKNVKVIFDFEWPDSATSLQVLNTRLAAKDEMDIVAVHAMNDIPVYAQADYLEDLSAEPFAAKVLPSVKDAVSYKGKVVGLPLESTNWGYIYNKKIFADNGIKPPTTLTEMKAVDKKLKEAKITPWLLAYKDTWVPQLINSLVIGAVDYTGSKDFIKNMNAGTGSYAKAPQLFEVMDEIHANGTAKPLDVNNDQGSVDFAAGKAAMWLQGPWNSDAILKANKDFQLGVAALPISDDPNQTLINLGISTTLSVVKTSKNKDVAKSLLNFFLEDATASEFYIACGFAPVATNQTIKVSPWVEDAMVYVKAGKTYLDPTMPQALKDETGKEFQGYLLKSKSKETVIKDLDKVWATSIKK